VSAVGRDSDLANGSHLSAVRKLGPALNDAIRIPENLREDCSSTEGEYFPMVYSPAKVDRHASHKLNLRPGTGTASAQR